MGNHYRFTTALAVVGLLAAGQATTARAQDTSAAARSDTMGYKASQSQTDTGKFKYNGAPSDTALKAKPGVQTGPAQGDSGKAAARTGAAGTADTVVCKDGSNAAGKQGCSAHGGVDKAATKAASKARGMESSTTRDSSAARSDTTQVNKQDAGNYQYHGAPSDTALKAKPGTQTGADTNATKSDTGASR